MSLRVLAPLAAAALSLSLFSACHTPATPPNEGVGLERFTACGGLKDYLADVMLETVVQSRYSYWRGPMMDAAGGDAPSADNGAESAPTDFTDTNNQEEGVDELDLVKSNGVNMFIASDRTLQIIDSWPAEEAHLIASVPLDGWARGLFLAGDKLVVLQSLYQGEVQDYPFERSWNGTRATVFDVSDPAAPTRLRTLDIEGYVADARLMGSDVYMVLNNWMGVPQEVWDLAWNNDGTSPLPEVDWNLQGEELDAAIAAAKDEARLILKPQIDAIVAGMDLTEVLPLWRDQLEGAAPADPEMMLGCPDLYRPADVAQFNILSIVNLDLETNDLNATGLVSDGWTLYASQQNLYVAQTSWWWWWGATDQEMTTNIHKFKLDPASGEPSYAGSGAVGGWVYDQFSMSEHNGYLRVATTDQDWWWGWWRDPATEDSEPANNVLVLQDDGVGTLQEVGALHGLAPGERIYASRMMGDVGYIVTFRQTDPLFTIDLSDPTAPAILGHLELPGYSAYLHPMDDTHLLAVGMAGTEDGSLTGLAINVFDVSDLAAPTLSAQYQVVADGWSYSEALWDHHAFTFHRGVLSIPAYNWNYDDVTGDYSYFSGMLVMAVTGDSVTELGRVDHRDLVDSSQCIYERLYGYEPGTCSDWGWYASMRRSRYVEDKLFSISDYGVKVNDLNNPATELTSVLFYPPAP